MGRSFVFTTRCAKNINDTVSFSRALDSLLNKDSAADRSILVEDRGQDMGVGSTLHRTRTVPLLIPGHTRLRWRLR